MKRLEINVDFVHEGSEFKPSPTTSQAAIARTEDEVRTKLTAFNDEELRLDSGLDASLTNSITFFYKLLIISAILAFALSLLIMQIFSRILIRRLADLGDKIRAFAEGGVFRKSAAKWNDEMSELDDSFFTMTEILAQKQTVLARYQLMVQSARDVILFVTCDDLRIIDANDAAIEAYGYDRATLLTMTISELRTPQTHAIHDYERDSAGSSSTLFESRHRRKDGTTFPVEVAGSSTEIDGRRVLLTVVRDVTDRKRAEGEHEKFFDRSNELMGVANLDGNFTRINMAWESTLGYSAEEMARQSILELIHPDDRKDSESVLYDLRLGKAISSFENRCIRKDGSYIWLAWSAIPSVEEGLIYAVARDVTKRKDIEAELALSRDQAMEASLLKSQFLANMSHEIRTPMNGIVATAELLLRSKLGGDEREYAGIISESAHALLTIINQILDLSKLEARKIELDSAEFAPLIMAENVTELLKFQSAQKNLSLSTFVAEEVPQIVRGDAGRLRQILLNLLGNAVKFTERGAVSLHVSLESDEPAGVTLRFAVADTGIGFSSQARERLFEPFTQVDGSNSRRYEGTGLGLSISKRLVELMHGEIGAESQPGSGSTFWFTARFAKVDAGAQPAFGASLRGRRMLIVGPDSLGRDIIARYVLSWGIRSAATSDASAVLALLREGADAGDPYHFVIVDLSTTDVDVSRLSELIASDARLSATKMIVASTPDVRARSQTSDDIAAFVSTPVKQSQLLDCLVTATHTPRAKQLATERMAHVMAPVEAAVHLVSGSPRILLAEDHEINRRIAVAQLKELGMIADVASNGQEAIDAYEKHRYDVILMDCQMPEVDGFAATRAIRAIQGRDGGDVRIIAMTANAMEGDRKTCIDAGMDDYLSKPVELESLREALLPTLGRSGASGSGQDNSIPRAFGVWRVLDVGRLRQVFRDDPEAINEALELSVSECRPLVAEMQFAVAKKASTAATQAAHKFKGICGNVGANELAAIGLHIEQAVKLNDWALAQAGCGELDDALERFVAASAHARFDADETPMPKAI
jgi:PAS domain S-box-containing protein